MPLSRFSICTVRKMAILRTSAEGHSEDRLINPTESPLGVNHVCTGLPGRDGGIKQEGIRMQKSVRFDNSIYSSANNRVVQPSPPA